MARKRKNSVVITDRTSLEARGKDTLEHRAWKILSLDFRGEVRPITSMLLRTRSQRVIWDISTQNSSNTLQGSSSRKLSVPRNRSQLNAYLINWPGWHHESQNRLFGQVPRQPAMTERTDPTLGQTLRPTLRLWIWSASLLNRYLQCRDRRLIWQLERWSIKRLE